MAPPIPPEVAAFRARYRSTEIGPRYAGRAHLAFTSGAALTGVVLAALAARPLSPLAWLALPIGFLVANLAEHRAHRGPMHHRSSRRALQPLFERHLLRHHRFYTAEAMHAESARDFQVTLFPPLLVFFFIGVLLMPLFLILRWVVSPSFGWLFCATGLAYFLLYEWLHLAYHLPPDSAVGRLAVVRLLRRHHQVHHDPAHMQKHNFNITFPLSDWLFGTTAPPDALRGRPS